MLGQMETHDFKDESKGEINPSKFFRKSLDLYANIRPARTYRGMPARLGEFDLVVVRENTEGFYADRNVESGGSEMLITPDVVVSLRRITSQCCGRLARTDLRLARTYRGMPARLGEFALVVVRENTEGFYADRNVESGGSEMLITPDVVVSLRRITRQCCERIARTAFELAMTRKKHVTIVHKANVLKIGDGMFIDICRQVGREFPEVRVDDVIVDAMMAHVVRAPERYDVVVTTNMFGDILSDLTAELSGSLGLGGSLNAGRDHAMGQAAHGSAPDIAGQDIANPASQLLSAAMLLNWYGQRKGGRNFLEAAAAIEQAIAAAIEAGQCTRDVGGSLGTRAAGQAVLDRL